MSTTDVTTVSDIAIQERWTSRLRLFIRRGQWEPYAYMLPIAALVLAFVYYPLLYNLYLSFFDWNMVAANRPFVGIANYQDLLAREDFRIAVRHTVYYLAGLLPLVAGLPLIVAWLISSVRSPFANIYRGILFVPTIISFVVVSLAWLWILNPIQGLLNQALALVGIGGPHWLGDPDLVLWTIVAITAWKMFGLNLILYIAGMTGIPRDLYEAASVDGASSWQQFRAITVPLLSPTILLVVVYSVIVVIQQAFVPVQVLTQGGPNNASNNLFYVTWEYAFRFLDTGLGAASATVLFVLMAILALAAFRIGERRVVYDR